MQLVLVVEVLLQATVVRASVAGSSGMDNLSEWQREISRIEYWMLGIFWGPY
jgi:hypothetical protein